MLGAFARKYGKLSLRGKLLSIIIATSACALLIGYALVLTTNISLLKSELRQSSRHIAAVVADSSIAPLSFSDADGAVEVLNHLETIPNVEAAIVIGEDGSEFARYMKNPEIELELPNYQPSAEQFFYGMFVTRSSIEIKGRKYGEVILFTSTVDLDARISGFVFTISGIFLVLLLAALYFANKLEHYISDRIIKLTDTTRNVTHEGSFDVRLHDPRNDDEISELYAGFNNMFDELRRREAERDKVETLLRVSEARFRAIVQDQTELICRCDLQLNINFVNEAFTRFFDTPFDKLIGKQLTEFIGEECQEDFKLLFEGADAKIPARSGELPVRKPDGCLGWLLWTIRAIFDEDSGELVAYQGVARDVSELRRAQEDKIEIERQLQHSQRMETIGTLAGGIAHDFNNILTPLGGYVDLLMMSLPPEGADFQRLEQISQALIRARELVRRILTFSRQAEQRRANIRLQDLVQNIITFLRASIPKTVKIEMHVDDFDSVVKGDESQLHQAIMNLCTNAYQAMKDRDSGLITLSLSARKLGDDDIPSGFSMASGEYVCLEIADTGCGIPEAVRGRIFDPFFTTKAVGEGTGLGLSVVHGIIVEHSGAITVESVADEGTTFQILLPCFAGEAEAAVKRVSKLHVGKERVLFIDDEEMIVEMGIEMLEMLGYSVDAFSSPVDAVEFYEKSNIDVDIILTDQTMPGMSGLDAIRKLRELGCKAPAIISTGYSADILSDDTLMALHVVDVLHKPYQLHELSDRFRLALEREAKPGELISA